MSKLKCLFGFHDYEPSGNPIKQIPLGTYYSWFHCRRCFKAKFDEVKSD